MRHVTSSDPSSKRVRDVLRRRFPDLSDRELTLVPGQEDKFVDQLQQRTGESEQTLRKLLQSAAGETAGTPSAPKADGPPAGTREDFDHSLGSGIPDDTSRSGGTGM